MKGVCDVIDNVEEEYGNCNIDKRVVWDVMKLKIKEYSIKYCKMKSYSRSCKIKEIERKLEGMRCSKNKDDIRCKKELESDLDILYTSKTIGAQIRARAQWIEEGERNTSYFLQLEQFKQSSSVIRCLEIEDKEECDNVKILEEIGSFYGNLYTTAKVENESVSNYLKNIELPNVLSKEQRLMCEGLPQESEFKNVIANLKSGKAPGSDGLPSEFYVTFWDKLRKHFMSFVIDTYIKGQLPNSTRHAIISLLYKKGNKSLLKNYRPISLTNSDYKIIAFVFAHRLQKVLPHIINEDQSGYIKGRYIGNNIRSVLDIYDYCEKENKEGAILC